MVTINFFLSFFIVCVSLSQVTPFVTTDEEWGEFYMGPAENTSFCSWFFQKLVRLNPEMQGKYVTIKPSLATAWLLAACTSPIQPAEEFTLLLLMLLREMKVLGCSLELSGSSGKTSHTVSHSFTISKVRL